MNGIASDRQRLGGQSTLPVASIGGAPSNLNSFAGRADSLRGDWPDSGGFGRPPFIQMMIDLAAVLAIVTLSCATGVGIAVAGFILLFVRT